MTCNDNRIVECITMTAKPKAPGKQGKKQEQGAAFGLVLVFVAS